MLTTVLSKVSEFDLPTTEAVSCSAADPGGTAVGVSGPGLSGLIDDSQHCLDTSEESHEGEADPRPGVLKGYLAVLLLFVGDVFRVVYG